MSVCPRTVGKSGSELACSTAYHHYGCRCDACLEWAREEYRKRRERNVENPPCKVRGCKAPTHSGQLCFDHYFQKIRRGATSSPLDECEICATSAKDNGRRLCVDHNHDTGEVRGVLCNRCNRALGLLQDNLDVLVRAVTYLRNKAP